MADLVRVKAEQWSDQCLNMKTATYYPYWGKARSNKDNPAAHHLLAYHSLDVAAVGRVYLQQHHRLRRYFCEALDCSDQAFLDWAAFCLSLHDLGKFSAAFQSQRADLVQQLQGHPPHANKIYSERHDSLGYWLWEDRIGDAMADVRDWEEAAVKPWIWSVTGHHGAPPKSEVRLLSDFFHREDFHAADAYVEAMGQWWLHGEAGQLPTQPAFEKNAKALSWWFAGVAVLADWLGSNTEFFPYVDQPQPLEEYWQHALRCALPALEQAGVLPAQVPKRKCFADFFPTISQPSPLQSWAMSVELPAGPQLYLLEDVTGAGKTEAALMLAYRLMEAGQADGLFIGLPTMATANAMYLRIAKVYRSLFGVDVPLTLAHGFRHLVDAFAKSLEPEHDPLQLDETATARCTAWLADNNKRALLAPAGVGTIDQALMAALYSKHQSLRLLGLFGKVLIVDEVHACDTYMQKILESLLGFHARAGGSVILLSATLPHHIKQSLVDAYHSGFSGATGSTAPILRNMAYPLATCWSPSVAGLVEMPMASRPEVSRCVNVHHEADLDRVYEHIQTALEQGQCVGWIRNTVADAMAAYTILSGRIDPACITLFHARFALADRLEKETDVLQRFGKDSTAQKRAGRLVIATQVAEQSLDVDWDVLISDLAPIDRIIQRAGRLQRHVRDAQGNPLKHGKDQRPMPCLWIYGPTWTVAPEPDWYHAVFRQGAAVYPHHGQLWRTAQWLHGGQYQMPLQARDMIEAVFSPDAECPAGLENHALKAEGEGWAAASQAQANRLKYSSGYCRESGVDWWAEAHTPSRLGEKTTDVMLARWEGGQLKPWAAGAWAYSMVRVAACNIDQPAVAPEDKEEVERLRLTLPAEGKWCVLLPLKQGLDGVWRGQAWSGVTAWRKQPELLTWCYDAQLGLRVSKT